MEKKDPENQAGGITHKKDKNAGSGAFNQGAEQDPDYDKGTKVSDEEKLTGHTPLIPDAADKNERANVRKNSGEGDE
jgi:hypothetical protein